MHAWLLLMLLPGRASGTHAAPGAFPLLTAQYRCPCCAASYETLDTVLRHDRRRIPMLLDFVRYPHNPAVQAEAVRITTHLSGRACVDCFVQLKNSTLLLMLARLHNLGVAKSRQLKSRWLFTNRRITSPFWQGVMPAKLLHQPECDCLDLVFPAERIPNLVPLLLNSPPTGNVPAVHRLQASVQRYLLQYP